MAFLGDAVDVRCAVADETHRVGTDIGLANIVTPDDEYVRLVFGQRGGRHNDSREHCGPHETVKHD
jgi:hypothetical protein